MMQTQPGIPANKRIFQRSYKPLVLLCWLALAYTIASSRLQTAQAHPLPLLSTWLQPALPFSQYSLCLFKDLTHLPCVFCGLTRSFVLIGNGQWQESLQYHLLGIPFYIGTVCIAVLGIVAPHQLDPLIRTITQRRTVYLVIAVLILCWLWKISHDPQFW